MNLLKHFSPVIIITIVLLAPLSGKGTNTSVEEARQIILFRQIGHEFLLSLGNHTSRILPVQNLFPIHQLFKRNFAIFIVGI